MGRIVDGIPVYPLDNMVEQNQAAANRNRNLDVACTTSTQQVVDQLAAAGIKGILNFTAARLTAPEDVIIQSVDLTNELQTLIYFLHHNTDNKKTKRVNRLQKARPKILL